MQNNFFHRHPITTVISILTVFIIISSWSILALVKHERSRDYDNWQITLGVMADSRANDVNKWVESQFAVLNSLAQNGSIQLYTQQLLRRSATIDESEPAQISYLRNLIYATAERNGFLDNEQAASPIHANISFQADNGLALISKDQEIITSTPGVGPIDNNLKQAILKVLSSGHADIYDIYLNSNNKALVGFITPVYALQVQTGNQEAIAVLFAFKNAQNTLFPLLKSDSRTTISAETMLVRKDGDAISYLSPLADGTSSLKKQLSANDLNLAAAYAVQHPGSFSQKYDYAGKDVIFTSRSLGNLPWVLVHKINVEEALSESNTHQQFLIMSLFLTALLVLALLIAAWWYGSSIRERKTTEELLLKSKELESKTYLLDAINDNISDFIFLSDKDRRFIFANTPLSKQLNISPKDIADKTIASVMGPENANIMTPIIQKVIAQEKSSLTPLSLELNGINFLLHAVFTPLPYHSDKCDAVLVTLHDVTQLQQAQEKQAKLMDQLIKAMMRAIDLHDPYSANHSAKTSDVAVAVGKAMNLSPENQSALETAANLCNIGKLFIAKDILTKTGKLSPEEFEVLQTETIYAKDILAGIDFVGPVIETITQKHEHLGGTGYPLHLSGEEILPTSRILAVANAFVAMISPRAYREGLTVKDALANLLSNAETHYDRKVIAALFHVAENEINWSTWHLHE